MQEGLSGRESIRRLAAIGISRPAAQGRRAKPCRTHHRGLRRAELAEPGVLAATVGRAQPIAALQRQEGIAPADLDDDIVRHLAPHHLDELRVPAAEARMRYGAAARRGRSGLDRARRVAAGQPRAVLWAASAVGDDERQQDEAGCGDRGDGYGLWGSYGGGPLAASLFVGKSRSEGRAMGSDPPVPS